MRMPKNPRCSPLGFRARIALGLAGGGLIACGFLLIGPVSEHVIATGSSRLVLAPLGCTLLGVVAIAAALAKEW